MIQEVDRVIEEVLDALPGTALSEKHDGLPEYINSSSAFFVASSR